MGWPCRRYLALLVVLLRFILLTGRPNSLSVPSSSIAFLVLCRHRCLRHTCSSAACVSSILIACRGDVKSEPGSIWRALQVELYLAGSPVAAAVQQRYSSIQKEYEELDTVWFMAGSLFQVRCCIFGGGGTNTARAPPRVRHSSDTRVMRLVGLWIPVFTHNGYLGAVLNTFDAAVGKDSLWNTASLRLNPIRLCSGCLHALSFGFKV